MNYRTTKKPPEGLCLAIRFMHKQLIQQAKVNKTKFVTLTISAKGNTVEQLMQDENVLSKNYLNNSLLEKGEDTTSLTMVISDGDKPLVDFIKRKIDSAILNDKTRYGKCDIMYSYNIYPKEKD